MIKILCESEAVPCLAARLADEVDKAGMDAEIYLHVLTADKF